MINIEVTVEATVTVSPRDWDTLGGLEASIKNQIANSLARYGSPVTASVTARAL